MTDTDNKVIESNRPFLLKNKKGGVKAVVYCDVYRDMSDGSYFVCHAGGRYTLTSGDTYKHNNGKVMESTTEATAKRYLKTEVTNFLNDNKHLNREQVVNILQEKYGYMTTLAVIEEIDVENDLILKQMILDTNRS